MLQHIVELDGLDLDIGGFLQRGVDRYQEILAADLKTVPGIVDDGEISAVDSGQIVTELAFKLLLGEVLRDENLEAGQPERGRDILGILGWVL